MCEHDVLPSRHRKVFSCRSHGVGHAGLNSHSVGLVGSNQASVKRTELVGFPEGIGRNNPCGHSLAPDSRKPRLFCLSRQRTHISAIEIVIFTRELERLPLTGESFAHSASFFFRKEEGEREAWLPSRPLARLSSPITSGAVH